MYSYTKYCPVAAATGVVGDSWTPLIERELLNGTGHFNQLARNVPGISRTLLAGRLRSLERAGVVLREQKEGGAGSCYELTAAGRDLQSIVQALSAWGTRWGLPNAEPNDLDPYMAICMLKSSLRVISLPETRVVIEAVISGPPVSRGWLVCERRQISVCVDPPGFEVDLFLEADAAAVYQIWRQILSINEAIRQRRLRIEGASPLLRALPTWFEVCEPAIPVMGAG